MNGRHRESDEADPSHGEVIPIMDKLSDGCLDIRPFIPPGILYFLPHMFSEFIGCDLREYFTGPFFEYLNNLFSHLSLPHDFLKFMNSKLSHSSGFTHPVSFS